MRRDRENDGRAVHGKNGGVWWQFWLHPHQAAKLLERLAHHDQLPARARVERHPIPQVQQAPRMPWPRRVDEDRAAGDAHGEIAGDRSDEFIELQRYARGVDGRRALRAGLWGEPDGHARLKSTSGKASPSSAHRTCRNATPVTDGHCSAKPSPTSI